MQNYKKLLMIIIPITLFSCSSTKPRDNYISYIYQKNKDIVWVNGKKQLVSKSRYHEVGVTFHSYNKYKNIFQFTVSVKNKWWKRVIFDPVQCSIIGLDDPDKAPIKIIEQDHEKNYSNAYHPALVANEVDLMILDEEEKNRSSREFDTGLSCLSGCLSLFSIAAINDKKKYDQMQKDLDEGDKGIKERQEKYEQRMRVLQQLKAMSKDIALKKHTLYRNQKISGVVAFPHVYKKYLQINIVVNKKVYSFLFHAKKIGS